jgi:chromosome segregation ATPase
VPWWTWTALVLFAVVVAVGAAVTGAALMQLKRLTKTGEDVARSLEELNAKTEALRIRLEHAEGRAQVVDRKLTKLDDSFERLSLLLWALGDARRTIEHVKDAITLRK